MDDQGEFLFADGPVSEIHLPDARSGLYEEIGTLWQIPVGQVVHVDLEGHQLSDLQGRLELARAPSLPLDVRESLQLRIGTIDFNSRQVVGWSLV